MNLVTHKDVEEDERRNAEVNLHFYLAKQPITRPRPSFLFSRGARGDWRNEMMHEKRSEVKSAQCLDMPGKKEFSLGVDMCTGNSIADPLNKL